MCSIDLRSRSYLLRLWREWRDGCWIQRASLEDALTGERIGFRDLKALFEHLGRAETDLAGTDPVLAAGEARGGEDGSKAGGSERTRDS